MSDQHHYSADPKAKQETILRDCHRQLLAGNPIASALLAEAALPVIQNFLRKKFPTTPPEMIASASADAIMDHLESPERYDASKSTLSNYLCMIAFRDLANYVDKERRRRLREVSFTDISSKLVELNDAGSEVIYKDPLIITPVETTTPEIILLEKEEQERLAQIFPDKTHFEVARMVLNGVRETDHFARVMGISHLDVGTQRIQVKQCKDMVKKRLERTKWK